MCSSPGNKRPDSTDFQVSAERGSGQFLKVDEQRKLMLL